MKTKLLFFNILLLLLGQISCDRQEPEDIFNTPEENNSTEAQLPEGYFEVNFITSSSDTRAKVPIIGQDTRVQHIQYIIYKESGEYVKEKTILLPSQGTATWPLPVIRDTLPKGNYKAVFVGNIEKTLFPYATTGSPVNYNEIFIDYKTTYSNARISIPPAEFSENTEYYRDTASFSDTSPNPAILLQRVIGMLRLHRNFVDTNEAVDKLEQNIVTEVGYRDIIKGTLLGVEPDHSDGELYETLRPVLTNRLTGLLTPVVDPLLNQLIVDLAEPVTNTLYNQLLDELTHQIELALEANASGNEGGFGYLGRMLNPWAYGAEAIVTLDYFPKSINFDLAVKESYPVDQKFKYSLKTDAGGTSSERYIAIKGLNGNYNVTRIDILAEDMVSGLVIDQVIDNQLLLPGEFVDITDPVAALGEKSNRRYRSDYSFVDLYLKSYAQQTDGAHNLTLSTEIGNVANIDNVLNGSINTVKQLPVLGPIIGLLTNSLVNLILADIKAQTVSAPVNLPLLGMDNMAVSGSWAPVTTY